MAGIIVAEGEVEVTANATGTGKKIADDLEKGGSAGADAAGQTFGRSVFGGVLKAFALVGGAGAVFNYFKGAITGASDLSETLSKSNAIFGEHASAIESFGNNAAQNVGLSKEAAIAAAAGFGDMFTQIGFASDEAAALSQTVVQASADLGSFNNLETADVADRISAAFRGEYDSLQAVIPNINAARVESEALAATGKTVAAELTAQEKAAAVLAIVQKDGARAMGDFERTSGGAANAAKIATASLEDQQQKLGGVLLPIWSGFLSFLNDTAIPAFSVVVGWIGDNTEMLGGLATAVGIAAGTFVTLQAGLALYNGVSAIFKAYQIAAAAATGGLTIAQWALNAAMSANPIGAIITALSLLVGGIVWVATQTTFFQDAWAWMTEAIGTAWNWLWTTVLQPVFTAIAEIFTWIYETIILPIVTGIMIYIGLWAAAISWLWTGVISPVFGAIGAIFNWIWLNVISPIVNFIVAGIQGWAAIISWLYSSVISPVMSAVGASFNWVWRSVISPVVNFISGAIRNVGNTVRSVFGGIGSFIGSAFQSALNIIRGPINGIIGLVNSAIRGINSLSVTIPSWVPIVGGQTWGLDIPTIPMLAKGGVIRSGGTVMVGERGPELLSLPTGAQVTPLNRQDALPKSGGDGKLADTIIIKEAEDPLGTPGRIAAELRKYRKR